MVCRCPSKDMFADRVLDAGSELQSDHPGFTDPEYRKRRAMFADLAIKYRYGTARSPNYWFAFHGAGPHPVPFLFPVMARPFPLWSTRMRRSRHGEVEDVLSRKTSTFASETRRLILSCHSFLIYVIRSRGNIYTKLRALYPTHACAEFNRVFPLLEQNCGYSAEEPPQLDRISAFLHSCTGFRLRPVAGLLSSRDFLAGQRRPTIRGGGGLVAPRLASMAVPR